jgi:hypothetical protein
MLAAKRRGTCRSRNQYPLGGYVSQTKGLMRRFTFRFARGRRRIERGLVGPARAWHLY